MRTSLYRALVKSKTLADTINQIRQFYTVFGTPFTNWQLKSSRWDTIRINKSYNNINLAVLWSLKKPYSLSVLFDDFSLIPSYFLSSEGSVFGDRVPYLQLCSPAKNGILYTQHPLSVRGEAFKWQHHHLLLLPVAKLPALFISPHWQFSMTPLSRRHYDVIWCQQSWQEWEPTILNNFMD